MTVSKANSLLHLLQLAWKVRVVVLIGSGPGVSCSVRECAETSRPWFDRAGTSIQTNIDVLCEFSMTYRGLSMACVCRQAGKLGGLVLVPHEA
jgi:hypothetical protein